MKSVEQLIENNARWAQTITTNDPQFFQRLATRQTPQFLWVGCSDSRVPATSVVELQAGDMFVHRNVANLILDNDDSAQAVITFAVDKLLVSDIIVCGHYGCGGVKAAMDEAKRLTDENNDQALQGVLKRWVQPIIDTYKLHQGMLDKLTEEQSLNRLSELNVIEQVKNVRRHPSVISAAAKRAINIHCLVYDISAGRLKILDVPE